MKIRNSFISNSSSSSFVCDCCSYTDGGWDLCLTETEMVQCEKGHTFCKAHAYININQLITQNAERGDSEDEAEQELWIENIEYNIPSQYCPVCNFEYVPDYMFVEYLIKQSGKTRDELKEMIKTKYRTYDNMHQQLG